MKFRSIFAIMVFTIIGCFGDQVFYPEYPPQVSYVPINLTSGVTYKGSSNAGDYYSAFQTQLFSFFVPENVAAYTLDFSLNCSFLNLLQRVDSYPCGNYVDLVSSLIMI
jgi:hypothetical protein